MKKWYLFLIILSFVLYGLTIRGSWGVPTSEDIEYRLNAAGQPFETSQERSRFAMVLSLYHDKTFSIDNFASMGTPDVGKINDHYYSLFPPMTSILALPLYVLGLNIGATQVTTFSISTIFAIATMVMIVKFGRKIGLDPTHAVFAAIAFGFATNAWGYSITLYAHLISAFCLITGLYLGTTLKNGHSLIKLTAVWLLYGLALFLDFPNIFIYFPIAILATSQAFSLEKINSNLKIKIQWPFLLVPFIFILCLAGYGYYNYVHFGSYSTLSNALPRVQDLKDAARANPEHGSDPVGKLHTRNMLEGFNSFITSRDRGMIFYTPIALLGLIPLFTRLNKKKELIGLVAVPFTCLTLYSMFPDPYGGWAFGSRYMVAVMPQLCLLAAMGLSFFGKNIFVKIIYTIVFVYSAGISLLAPLTTNVIPPFVEARTFGLDSWFIVNWNMLVNDQLSSYFYNHILYQQLSGTFYYSLIFATVSSIGAFLIWYPSKQISYE